MIGGRHSNPLVTQAGVSAMILTCALLFFVIVLAILALFGEWIVWQIPTYKQFNMIVQELESTSVTTIKNCATVNKPLRSIGRWRLPEVFDTGSAVEDMTILQCFGMMFVKDKSFDELIGTISRGAGAALIIAAVGTLFVFLKNDAGVEEIQKADIWDKVPKFFDLLLHNEGIGFIDLLTILVTLSFLLQNTAFLRRINRAWKN